MLGTREDPMLSVDGQLLLWTVMGVIVTFLLIMACDDCNASACSLVVREQCLDNFFTH